MDNWNKGVLIGAISLLVIGVIFVLSNQYTTSPPGQQTPPGKNELPPQTGSQCKIKAMTTTGFTSTTPYIVGGYVAEAGQFPWAADIGGCGGALIHPRWIVTAAHCNPEFAVGSKIYLGRVKRSLVNPLQQVVTIKRAIMHPNYVGEPAEKSSNDIALIELNETVTLNDSVNVACLANLNDLSQFQLMVIGWGNTKPEDGPYSSDVLKFALVKEMSPCAFSKVDLRGKICVKGSQTGGFACLGDSGSPLMANVNGNQYLVGVVSFGTEPCVDVAVFTRLTAYRSFLKQYIPDLAF